ncbi:MAG TPA: hypothetical protein VLW85_15395, partial [Myxococcales bacterium]|nr:hypothetical protein [Myxococcales bacterium]
MMQASIDSAQADSRLQEQRNSDGGLGSAVKGWHDAADALHGAITRARATLLADGSPQEHVERIEDRLKEIKEHARNFDLEEHFDGVVGHWQALGVEMGQLAGRHRDTLVRLLGERRVRIDQTTALLSRARQSEGMLPEAFRKVQQLTADRDQRRQKYEQLRQKYLEAERDYQAAEQEKQQEQVKAKELATEKAPVGDLKNLASKGPVLVRLPDPQGLPGKKNDAKPDASAKPVLLPPRPQAVPLPKKLEQKLEKPKKPETLRKVEKKVELKDRHEGRKEHRDERNDRRDGRKEHKEEPKKPVIGAHRPAMAVVPKRALSDAQKAQLAGKPDQQKPNAPSGPPKISVERVEKPAGFPAGADRIGRGGQTATIFFRADHLEQALQIQGSASIQLGCGVKLDVLPSVQLFSGQPGQAIRGKLSLGLISSGGRLGTVPAKNAQDAAKLAASKAAPGIAGRLGSLGRQLGSAIEDVLDDAAGKIFARAESKPLTPATGAKQKGPSAEFQVQRFNSALGSIIVEARQVKAPITQKSKLPALLDRDHQHRDSVADRLEKTLQHLATATHRTLTDSSAGEMRSNLARMDSILARLKGKAGQEIHDGAQEISGILSRMNTIAATKGGAPHVAEFRKLIEERKGQLRQIIGAPAKKPPEPKKLPPHAVQHSVHQQLSELRKHNPGLDKLLKHASQSQLAAELARVQKSGLHKLPAKPGAMGLGSYGLTGAAQLMRGGHLGGFGGGHRVHSPYAGGLQGLSGMDSALSRALDSQLKNLKVKPHEMGKILAGFQKTAKGAPLHDLTKRAEEKARLLAARRAHRGPMPAATTADALLQVFRDHPKGKAFAAHVAPGGALRSLCEGAQRGHGLPVGQMAQHYLASRGQSQVWNAVSTYNSLVKQGNKPHFWSLGSIAHAIKDKASGALSKVTSSVQSFGSSMAGSVKSGLSSFGGRVMDFGKNALTTVKSVASQAAGGARKALGSAKKFGGDLVEKGRTALHDAGGAIGKTAHRLADAGKSAASHAWGGITRAAGNISHVASSALHAGQGVAHWAQGAVGKTWDKVKESGGKAFDWAKHKAETVEKFARDKVHAGLQAAKTGVLGGLKGGLKTGLSFLKKTAEYSPLGLAFKAAQKTGQWVKQGGLQKTWAATKKVAGKAWGGLKTAYNATSKFLQSPAGQLLVTGVSLAASFIPGGMVVKGLIGAGIGAITAISEGKDWKGILAGAGSGALTAAVPFLKLGPLAKVGVGALSGGVAALASGGNWKDALKGAAGGALDSIDPGAFTALKKLKGFTTAGKLLKGKNLSKAEQAFLEGNKFAAPLRGLEKAMGNPKFRKAMGGLEKATSKGIKGGIWLSGKAAKVQGALDKVVGAGDKVHGVLSEVHAIAPGISSLLGDNAAGHFVSKLGDLAGKGDDKLSKALEYGHSADDKLHQATGLLNKGLKEAGVKNPKKAYDKMMARKDLKAGKKGGLEKVAQQKLEDHKRKHPELHLAEATGKRTRGAHVDAKTPRKRLSAGGTPRPERKKTSAHEKVSPHDTRHVEANKTSKAKKGKLEAAVAKGKKLIQKGQKVAQGVHDGLGKVHSVVARGLEGAQKVQGGLETASKLAKQGADILGEDTELGQHLMHVAEQADKVHGYLEQGLGVADEFNKHLGAVHDGMEHVPGVHREGEQKEKDKKSPLEQATLLHGKPGGTDKPAAHDKKGPGVSPHDAKARPGSPAETEAQKSDRYKRAWD